MAFLKFFTFLRYNFWNRLVTSPHASILAAILDPVGPCFSTWLNYFKPVCVQYFNNIGRASLVSHAFALFHLHGTNGSPNSWFPAKNLWTSDKSWEPGTLSHSLIPCLSTCWTTFVFMSMLKSHSLTLTVSHSHTLSISHSLTLDMLNNFCFHLYAQKWLFIAESYLVPPTS